MTTEKFIEYLTSEGWQESPKMKGFEGTQVFKHPKSYSCITIEIDGFVQIRSIGQRGQPVGEASFFAKSEELALQSCASGTELCSTRKVPLHYYKRDLNAT